jgi:hypothetical protein
VVSGGKFTSTRFFAWSEWFSLPSVEILNFPVSVGDRIACTVCAPIQGTNGSAILQQSHHESDHQRPYHLRRPIPRVAGNVAEWIIEDPSQSSGAPFPFPVYSGTTFTGCTGGTRNIELHAWDGKEIDMIQGGVTLSSGIIQGKQTVFCHYGA